VTRRPTEHVHPDHWTRQEQYRFEDRVSRELEGIRADLEQLASRLLMVLGGIVVLAFVVPLLVPVMRDWLRLP